MGRRRGPALRTRIAVTAGVLALYGGLALAVLSPLASPELVDSAAQDLANHVSGIIEAKAALEEGQFPLRVAPGQLDRQRYPMFQYYGNFPYTVGGLLHRWVCSSPYSAWKMVTWTSLVTGGFFTYLCGLRMARRRWPAILGGALFLTSPYMITDIHGRFAFPELVSLNLLPAVLYAALGAFARRLTAVFASGLAWALLALTHNITFFYGSLFLGGWFVWRTPWSRRGLGRLLCLGAAYTLGLALTAWYVVPQLATLPLLRVHQVYGPVRDWSWLTPLGVLLSPGMTVPLPVSELLETERLGLQIGWPMLAGVALAVYCRFAPGLARSRMRRNLGQLLVLFFLALFAAWAPVDIYDWLPDIFSYVQFSYRLLMFVVLFGSLLGACALACRFGATLRFEHALLCLCLLGSAAAPYLQGHLTAKRVSLASEMRKPDMGRGGGLENFQLRRDHPRFGDVACPSGPASPGPIDYKGLDCTRPVTVFGRDTTARIDLATPSYVVLPVLAYPHVLRVRDNRQQIPYGCVDKYVLVQLPAGSHAIQIRYVGIAWANNLSEIALVFVSLGLAGCFARAAWRRLALVFAGHSRRTTAGMDLVAAAGDGSTIAL